ncbi:EthD family reductase [Acidocella sp.]|uniref:EthD family reductase n=1 Tax=Acidocella sp. TaxID=50710 RepID=UPI0026371076|nr:EthD family reductase [Acidocella sp.]
MIAITVIYPYQPDYHFDFDYYLNKHMPLVEKRWGPMGLGKTTVLAGQPGPDGKPPLYAVMTIIEFESAEAFQKAAAAHGGELFGDVPNFTNIPAVSQLNQIKL